MILVQVYCGSADTCVIEEPVFHYNDVIIGTMASHITSLSIAFSNVYSGADQRKHQTSATLAFVRGIHRWPVMYVSHKSLKLTWKVHYLKFHSNFAGVNALTSQYHCIRCPSREKPLRWRHNGCNGVSNHRHHDNLLNHLFRRTSKKTSKLHVTGLCEGNPPVTGNAESIVMSWRHHVASAR